MNRKRTVLFFLMVLCIALPSCLQLKQPSLRINYYTLEYDPPRMGPLEPLPLIIKMNRFGAAPEYSTRHMIYRDDSFKRQSYVYHKWRANPGDLVGSFLARDMRRSGLFRAVLPEGSGFAASHRVEGALEEFFEQDLETGWKAVLALTITLMVEQEPDVSKRVIFQKTYQGTETCTKKTPRDLAEAMSSAMAGISRQITKDIYDSLNR